MVCVLVKATTGRKYAMMRILKLNPKSTYMSFEFTLEKLEAYQLSETFSDLVWNEVVKWKHFEKDTIGKQLARSVDSNAANIAEEYGKFYCKESRQFYFYARGSIRETKAWLSKCLRRHIIDEDLCKKLIIDAETILTRLNAYIKFVVNSSRHNTDQLT